MYYLQNASYHCYRKHVTRKREPRRRSECPLNASVEMLGDRWSLLIIRDMMLRGFRTYKQFLECYEGIATNILADRLRKLTASGIIAAEPDPCDGRRLTYRLTAKGIDLAPVPVVDGPAFGAGGAGGFRCNFATPQPVLTEMVLWAAAHEDTGNQALVRQMRDDRVNFLAGVRQRWAQRTANGKKHNTSGTKHTKQKIKHR